MLSCHFLSWQYGPEPNLMLITFFVLYFECTIWFNKANNLIDFCIFMIKYPDAFNEAKCKCDWLLDQQNTQTLRD